MPDLIYDDTRTKMRDETYCECLYAPPIAVSEKDLRAINSGRKLSRIEELFDILIEALMRK